ncbi:hypothetical protein IW262DRAFT_1529339 [Armillaria fumosa]|nr:hypothetical protein IW262DRAFT_1529339 [Armillaria fumosa]
MILPPSNGNEEFSGPSSASEMMSPPRTPSNLMKYTVELVVVVVLKLTMTFHKICPSLASHGDYTHSPPSTIVGTSTLVAPPQELIWPPSSFESRSHAHPTSTTNNTFLPVFKCHGDEFFSKQHPIQEVRINCPRRHRHHTATATPYNSYFLRIFDHGDGFLGFKRLYRLQGSHRRNILSPNAIGVDESYAGSFEHAWYADGEQVSKSKQPAGPPASGSGTIFPRCLRLEDVTILSHPQWLDSMKYKQRRDILTLGSKRSKEGIFKNRIRWNNDKSGPGATSSISTISTSLTSSSTFSMTSSPPLTSSSTLPVTSMSFLPPSITTTFVTSTTSQTDTITSSPSILTTSEESSTTSLATIVTSISGQLTAYNASQSFLGFYLLLSKRGTPKLIPCKPECSPWTAQDEQPAGVHPVYKLCTVFGWFTNASEGEESRPMELGEKRSHPMALSLETGNLQKRSQSDSSSSSNPPTPITATTATLTPGLAV